MYVKHGSVSRVVGVNCEASFLVSGSRVIVMDAVTGFLYVLELFCTVAYLRH